MKYYAINESDARRSKEMMSYSDYKPMSATNSYKASVDEVYKLAEEKKARVNELYHEKIDALADKYARKLANYINEDKRIGCMCPSVMICGPANFPVRKKEKQVAAWDRLYATWDSIENIKTQILRVGTGRDAIKSDDENAIEKLEIKLKKAQDLQTYMKKVNAYYRKHKTCKGCDGVNDETANKLDESMKSEYTWGTAPFPSFRLTNNNAKIKNTKNRLARLQAAKSKPTEEIATLENDYCKVVENTEIMRIQLIFDGKPDAEVRKILKSNGFRWAPSQGAWQRQLTSNGKYATKQVLTELKSVVA